MISRGVRSCRQKYDTGYNKVNYFSVKILMFANDRHPVWISISKKENVLVPISDEPRNN